MNELQLEKKLGQVFSANFFQVLSFSFQISLRASSLAQGLVDSSTSGESWAVLGDGIQIYETWLQALNLSALSLPPSPSSCTWAQRLGEGVEERELAAMSHEFKYHPRYYLQLTAGHW